MQGLLEKLETLWMSVTFAEVGEFDVSLQLMGKETDGTENVEIHAAA